MGSLAPASGPLRIIGQHSTRGVTRDTQVKEQTPPPSQCEYLSCHNVSKVETSFSYSYLSLLFVIASEGKQKAGTSPRDTLIRTPHSSNRTLTSSTIIELIIHTQHNGQWGSSSTSAASPGSRTPMVLRYWTTPATHLCLQHRHDSVATTQPASRRKCLISSSHMSAHMPQTAHTNHQRSRRSATDVCYATCET